MYLIVSALLIQSAMHIFVSHIHKKQWMRHMESKEAEWHKERQQLLDRIQSPSFAEYKHQEVKVIKAQNNVPEPPKLEVM